MKKTLLRFFACILVFPGMAQTIVSAGFVTGPWTASGSPYLVTGDIQCNNLDIQPGVDVRFQNGSGLVVYGSLRALGTAAQPVIFESDDTTGWSNFSIAAGGTKGICVVSNSANDTSILDHCIIKDAKGLISNNSAVCVYAYLSNLVLSNSEIFHNYISGAGSVISAVYCSPQIVNNSIHDNIGRACGGIDIEVSHGLISGNDIYHNSSGQGGGILCISISDPAGPTIINNHIHDNRASLDAGGIMVENGPVTIINNNISFNHSARSGAGIYVMSAHAKIFSNLVCNNTDSIYPNCGITDGGGGINVNNGANNDTAEIYNNIIANNNSFFNGGGIRVSGSGGTAFIENNHVINNTCQNGPFTGGIELGNDINGSIRNNIIWGNRTYNSFSNGDSVQLYAGVNDTFALEYNCFESSAAGMTYINMYTQVNGNQATNISVYGVNPGIIAPTLGKGITYDATIANWHLTSSSVCIDAGTVSFLSGIPLALDFYSDPRQSGATIDIGAVEYSATSGIAAPGAKTVHVFPNPATEAVYIDGGDPEMEICITDVLGNRMLQVKYGTGIDVSALSPGVYFITFAEENANAATVRFVKNK